MLYQHFSAIQIIPILTSLLILFLALILFLRKERTGLFLLILGSVGLSIAMTILDPFLILWDEQYHALVAKNLASNPLVPKLYPESPIYFDFRNWTSNSIWLHKQPLFLWQIALSLKVFGNWAWAVRLPSAIMHGLLPYFIYRIGLLSLNKRSAIIAAFFLALAFYPLELVAGRFHTDHNDVAFLFYTLASFWAWFEYQKNPKMKWLILIGIFSGCAVLVKWLMGLLVFALWFSVKFLIESDRFKLRSYTTMMKSFGIGLIIFLPWQLYAFLVFPEEASYEIALNGKHFFEAVEGHSGPWHFHFSQGIRQLYGEGVLIPFLIIAGLVTLFIRVKDKYYRWFMAIAIVFVYLFYSLAETKMISFPIIVFPFVILSLASLVDWFLNQIEIRSKINLLTRTFGILLISSIGFLMLNLKKIQGNHTMWKPHDNHKRSLELKEMRFIDELKRTLGSEKHVIFNADISVNGHIPVMFFTQHIAYDHFPSLEELEELQERGFKIAIVDQGDLPGELSSLKHVRIIPTLGFE